jgi:hypothetical protein
VKLDVHALAVALALAACNSPSPPPGDPPPTADPTPADPAAVAPTAAPESAGAERLLDWLDPDAIAVAFLRLPADVDIDAIADIFALPPKTARLLRDATGIDAALEAVLPPDRPRPSEWLAPDTLAMSPVVATGTYVVRKTARPRAEVEAVLQAAGMTAETLEGFTIYLPARAFPYKIVFLADDLLAFVPLREIGGGLGPLTAGRDLPAGPAEQELRKSVGLPEVLLELYATGPLLHFELDRDVLQLAFAIRSWDQGGMDAAVRVFVEDDAALAMQALEKHEAQSGVDRIDALAERVAYTLEGPLIEGRLQLTAGDVAALRKRS